MEVLVFDNELPIYHTTVADVALRKSPLWQEMFSIGNIKKIMNDKDVILSKGKDSLKRLHADAMALLDLTYTGMTWRCWLKRAAVAWNENRSGKFRNCWTCLRLAGFRALDSRRPGAGFRDLRPAKRWRWRRFDL